ncbi:double-strand break repair helicase AddA [Rhodalgimonas zhirmunskyi]|uniref:DNA 3'-5' helicase n=1 Tax=Rhodalgimonas zhirmunskyi TaxID=2964767 RepID=A0AAJ1X597_9RHOB|nr:double-strand break repair helicase AddA [Rhodoalgimonas zhirmunskyi]MDQ2094326.1 double-strand break repair helicase AddA [Rhodoalgimonas zhirmunskyi]
MTKPNEATLAQIEAANPQANTWLSANAGSGKTRVLTDRVARLLLSGVNPQNILCLTYTKAAASEMQNRLFRRLGEWAMLPDAALRAALQELSLDTHVAPETLAEARRLFAGAIETPGGLRIQTIHAFCAALLRRFPLEAGVSPRFTEMDDRAAALLREDIVEHMSEGDERDLVLDLVRHISDDDSLDKLMSEITRQADAFADPMSRETIYTHFGLAPETRPEDIAERAFAGGEAALLTSLLPALRAGSANDVKAAEKLALVSELTVDALPILEQVFLTGRSAKEPFCAKIGTFPTKATQATIADMMPALEAFMRRVEDTRTLRIALYAAQRTAALHGFAGAFLGHYEAAKQARGWLDFDDLISRARNLLNDPRVAAWVLYRLDGGIDHILVDEAQDTSPTQWNVIDRLAQEFTAGEGARADVPRTIFVVGDKKQSIYSFQGADPREFDRMRAEFQERLAPTNTPLQDAQLAWSFRSSGAILSLVDMTFEDRAASGFTAGQDHKAFFDAMPGRVDLWPVLPKLKIEKEEHEWFKPVNQTGPEDPVQLLARAIAGEMGRMISENVSVPAENGKSMRACHAGDFLVLVQRRSPLFHAIIRECKALGLPIAGADRLRVGAELAVRDIAVLLQFLATPEDDLALATALRSPLFGWSEQALYTLAQPRKGFLWAALRDHAADHPETMAILDDMRRNVDYLRPYDLIERILTRHDGRRRLLARLGREAEDGIDALLGQALAYEQNAVPSLTGFLVWMETDNLDLKRQMESAGRQIRVMTVHAAKGLEAPIVILPDTGQRRDTVRDQILPGDVAIWKPNADMMPPQADALIEARKESDRQERDRLLYVAMTRAECWLIVAAAGELGRDGLAWHDVIRTAMEAADAAPLDTPTGNGLRLQHGTWGEAPAPTKDDTQPQPETQTILPDWVQNPAPIAAPRPKALSPSDLGGAKALPGAAGQDEEEAKRYGRQVHLLLEHLPAYPPATWESVSEKLLSSGPDAALVEERAALLAEAKQTLNSAELEPLFASDTLAEVPISASLDALQGRRIHGIIDRLVIGENNILAVDFKTNAIAPARAEDCPDGLLRQMGAYAAALEQVFPGKNIATALLWTKTATLMHLPHDLVMQALQSTHILDEPTP